MTLHENAKLIQITLSKATTGGDGGRWKLVSRGGKKKKRKVPYDRKQNRSNRRGGESKNPWRRHEVITTGKKKTGRWRRKMKGSRKKKL